MKVPVKIVDWEVDDAGGWVLYKPLRHPIREQPLEMEWWYTDSEHVPDPRKMYDTYRFNLPDDVFAEHNWVNADRLASFLGESSTDLKAKARSEHPLERAYVMLNIIAYYGPTELDQYPIQRTGGELRRRWPRVFKGMGRYSKER